MSYEENCLAQLRDDAGDLFAACMNKSYDEATQLANIQIELSRVEKSLGLYRQALKGERAPLSPLELRLQELHTEYEVNQLMDTPNEPEASA